MLFLPANSYEFFSVGWRAICLSFVLMWLTTVQAHEVRPAIIDLNLDGQGGYEAIVKVNLEALIAGIGDEHEDTDDAAQADTYNAFRKLPPGELKQQFDMFRPAFLQSTLLSFDGEKQDLQVSSVNIPEVGDVRLARDSQITLRGSIPPTATQLMWQWPEVYGNHVIRISSPEQEEVYTAYLQAGESSEPVALTGQAVRSGWAIFSDYVVIGYEHILPKGLDHILFVVGLFLLSASISTLLWQVTSFTLAHSVTLALGMLGWIQISPSIVEPLIAASIVYVCLENVFHEHLSRWRPLIIFLFGLLHGLGFASVLTDIGLGSEHFALGLLAFNVGVELGQLSVILLCFLAVGFWFRNKSWYRSRISIPASLVIAAIGAYWFLERTVLATA